MRPLRAIVNDAIAQRRPRSGRHRNNRAFPLPLIPAAGRARGNHEVRHLLSRHSLEEDTMDGLIYLIGLIVIIMAILSFFGLR